MIPGGGWLKNAADSAVRGLHEDLVWMLELTTLLFGVFDGHSEVGKGNVTFSIYSHWQLQQKWIELHKYDIYLNIYTAVVRAGDRPSLYLFYYFPSTIVLTESSSLSNSGGEKSGEVACIQREVLLRQVSAHLTNGAVSTVSTQYLLYLPRLGPDFVIFIVPRPGGHQAGLGWACWLTGRE